PLPYPLGTVLAALATDKKHTDGSLHWVLPSADGPVVRSDVSLELVERVATAVLAAPTAPADKRAGG
ncbi:MAG TPA: hypothetical protein VIM24_07240, partial [Candidatus Limnocylindrales bacterium]